MSSRTRVARSGIHRMKTNTDKQKIHELLTRGVDEVIDRAHLEKQLSSGKKLRVKFGIDPTGTDLHLGHAVPLRKLRQFQDLGHQVVLLIGDFTAMIGDPTGRNETRPMLNQKDVKQNMKTYIKQASKILDMKRVEVRHNSEWYSGKRVDFLMELTGKITVARVLDRDDFKKRLHDDVDIQMQEILYPVLQGYDSVALKADMEMGGRDQKFNMLMGRKIQRRYDQSEQDVMTLPLLVGTDGERKMSKTYGNYIALLDTADDMYGKVMSIPDTLIISYFELCTALPMDEIAAIKRTLDGGANPRDLKMQLAAAIVALYHGKVAAKKAEAHFREIFQEKEKPADMPTVKARGTIVDVLVAAKIATSKSDARRLIDQGGVKIDDVVVTDADMSVKRGAVIQKGKRFFVEVVS